MKKYAWAFGTIALVCALVLGAYLLMRSKSDTQSSTASSSAQAFQLAPGFSMPSASSSPARTVSDPGPRTPPAGSKEYRNTQYGFSLFYPDDLSVTAYDEGAGASTIVFQDTSAVQGFQMFIVPYSEPQVSAQRFAEDEPSGVIQDPQNIELDGTYATIFYGQDLVLGATREVWFIHGDYLFEVTAPKSLDDWLGSIMTTWEFI